MFNILIDDSESFYSKVDDVKLSNTFTEDDFQEEWVEFENQMRKTLSLFGKEDDSHCGENGDFAIMDDWDLVRQHAICIYSFHIISKDVIEALQDLMKTMKKSWSISVCIELNSFYLREFEINSESILIDSNFQEEKVLINALLIEYEKRKLFPNIIDINSISELEQLKSRFTDLIGPRDIYMINILENIFGYYRERKDSSKLSEIIEYEKEILAFNGLSESLFQKYLDG